MGTVYIAQDLKHDRAVAIRVLRAELATVLGRERFLREIKFAARLNHPHILPLLDSGEAQGLLYYVMPYVVGESLLAPCRKPWIRRCSERSLWLRSWRRPRLPASDTEA